MSALESFFGRMGGRPPITDPSAHDRARGAERIWQATVDMAGRLAASVEAEREAAVTTAVLAVSGAQTLGQSIEALEAATGKLSLVEAIAHQTRELIDEARAEASVVPVDLGLHAAAGDALDALDRQLAEVRRLLMRLRTESLQHALATNDPAGPSGPRASDPPG